VLTIRRGKSGKARIVPVSASTSDRLIAYASTDRKPLWDGKSTIQVREATAAQHAEWEQSRDQAISDGEIDLDAGNSPERLRGLSFGRRKQVPHQAWRQGRKFGKSGISTLNAIFFSAASGSTAPNTPLLAGWGPVRTGLCQKIPVRRQKPGNSQI
jgi:hypothetical protein